MMMLLGLLALALGMGLGLIYLCAALLFGLAGLIGLVDMVLRRVAPRRTPDVAEFWKPIAPEDWSRGIPMIADADAHFTFTMADLLASSRPITFPDPPSRETIAQN